MTTRRRFVTYTLGFAAVMPAYAQRGRWDYLGEANVDGSSDHDKIKVGRGYGAFRAIRLHVELAPIAFDRVTIEFSEGDRTNLPVNAEVPAGGQSPVLQLSGNPHHIANVEFWYRRVKPDDPKPKVKLFGLH